MLAAFLTDNATLTVADGRLSQAEADEAVRAVKAAAEAGHAFAAVTVFGFLVRKPDDAVTEGSQGTE